MYIRINKILAELNDFWLFEEYCYRLMATKTSFIDCKCMHCQKKSEQINNARSYWSKILLSKNLA